MIYAVPNGAVLASKREMAKLKAEGLSPGVPDLCLAVPKQGYCGLYIEMKFGDNQPHEHQVEWLDKLSEWGYLATTCWSGDDAIETICDYLALDKAELIG